METSRPICEKCNLHPCEKSGNGKGWRKTCVQCRRPHRNRGDNRYKPKSSHRDFSIRPFCEECQLRLVERAASSRGWRRKCEKCRRQGYRNNPLKHTRRQLRESVGQCQQCGFVPVHICQLEVDHIDGDHNNNERTNWQVLCANCHKLKTHLNGEYASRNGHKKGGRPKGTRFSENPNVLRVDDSVT